MGKRFTLLYKLGGYGIYKDKKYNVVINILNRWNTMRNGFDTLEDAKNYIKHLLHAEASAKAELLHGGL